MYVHTNVNLPLSVCVLPAGWLLWLWLLMNCNNQYWQDKPVDYTNTHTIRHYVIWVNNTPSHQLNSLTHSSISSSSWHTEIITCLLRSQCMFLCALCNFVFFYWARPVTSLSSSLLPLLISTVWSYLYSSIVVLVNRCCQAPSFAFCCFFFLFDLSKIWKPCSVL